VKNIFLADFQPITSNLKRRIARSLLGAIATGLLSLTTLAQELMPLPSALFLPAPVRTVSTVPQNGDVNPYGVAFVPFGFPSGVLNPGDILVSNFNDSQNLQGTGTTIVRVPQQGSPSLFFQSQSPNVGLSTALAVLKEGLVIVGAFPTADGTCNTAQNGALLVVNSAGQQVQVFTDQNYINGPWDMTVQDFGNGNFAAFVSNALTGEVVRFNLILSGGALTIQSKTVIGSGYLHRCDPAALVVAPTGLVYDPKADLLYVASTDDNAVFAIPNAAERTGTAGTGQLIYQDQTHLHGPLAMAVAPNGHLLVSNADVINPDPNQPSEVVEFSTVGQFLRQLPMDPNLGGSFGLNVSNDGVTSRFAAVDDNTATLSIWTLPSR
jgi:hypothetical protein